MIFSSEHRISVANAFRSDFGVVESLGKAWSIESVIGMQICAQDETVLRNGMRILADLIDPTCTMEDSHWDDGQCTWGCICSACGAKHEHECSRYLKFCSQCGARVVDGDE